MEMWGRMQEGMLQMLVPGRKPRSSTDPDEPADADGTEGSDPFSEKLSQRK
jgi:hypothetical protein